MRNGGVILLVLLLLSWFTPDRASSEVLRVPIDFGTIAGACAAAVDGDTVAVYDGVYEEAPINVPAGVSVIGMGTDPGTVTIIPEAANPYTVKAESGDSPITIQNLYIRALARPAINNDNSGLVIDHCWVLCEPGWDSYIIEASSSVMIRHCDLWYYGDPGLFFSLTHQLEFLVEDCVIGGNEAIEGFSCPSGSYFEFQNNTFLRTVFPGVVSGETDFAVLFLNNVFDEGAQCSETHPHPDTIEWRYNDFAIAVMWPECGYQVGNFSAPPLFCDPSASDYRINWESPCRGSGEEGRDVGARRGYCNQPPAGIEIPLVPQLPSRDRLVLSRSWPNPTTGTAHVELRCDDLSPMDANVFDISGQLIRRLQIPAAGSSGGTILRWDGMRSSGLPAPTGIYYIRVAAEGEAAGRQIHLVR